MRTTVASVPPSAASSSVSRLYGAGQPGSKNSTGLMADASIVRVGSSPRCRERVPSGSPAGLSACIITHDEADRIEACIRSVAFCDEVVVVDSHSTDGTRELAAALGARVIERDWPGYRSQKQF